MDADIGGFSPRGSLRIRQLRLQDGNYVRAVLYTYSIQHLRAPASLGASLTPIARDASFQAHCGPCNNLMLSSGCPSHIVESGFKGRAETVHCNVTRGPTPLPFLLLPFLILQARSRPRSQVVVSMRATLSHESLLLSYDFRCSRGKYPPHLCL